MSDAPAAETETKTKAQLKAERRAKQEAQRAAKEALKKSAAKPEPKKLPAQGGAAPAPVEKKKESPKQVPETVVKQELKKEKKLVTEYSHEVNLFKHLYINSKSVCKQLDKQNVIIHPAILRFGTQYAEKTIVGSNARCAAFLAAIKHLILDYERPAQADFTRGLEVSLKDSVNYLNSCRPSSVPMQNALKFLKKQMNNLPPTISDEEAKSKLISIIDKYVDEQIDLADKAISNVMQQKISNGDVILVYGFSSLIYKILCKAFMDDQKFRVVVIDSRPHLEGREMLRRLAKTGIDCSYFLINAVSYIMPQVSKVFLGVHAILANGAAVSRVGTAQVAWEASGCNVPVLVACGTHKSCERVQTDSIVHNEIGDPDQIIESTRDTYKPSRLTDWKNRKTLNLLNIMYDVTPADLITAIITELEPVVPSTCVPVLLRMILNNN